MNVELQPRSILWQQVWGLAAMLAAILLSFTIYGFYQPQVLIDLGFLKLADRFGILQGLLGFLVEPLCGGFSDVIMKRLGSRLPFITVGVTIVGLLFVAIALLLPIPSFVALRWPLLILMLFWLVAAIAIRGPIMALLRQFAPVEQLPVANEVLIVVLGLVGAVSPLVAYLLTLLGPSISFIMGAIAITSGSIILYRTVSRSMPKKAVKSSETPVLSPEIRLRLGLMPIIGIGVGCLFNLVFTVAPTILDNAIAFLNSTVIVSTILFLSAISSVPWGRWTQKWQPTHALKGGLGAIVILLVLLTLKLSTSAAILLLLGFGIVLGLAFISIIPFALSYIPLTRAGLSTGLFFGGSGAGSALVLFWQQHFNGLTPFQSFMIAAIALAVTASCLQFYRRVV
ncbi:MAG: MFS transporter [Spirulina sp.]